MADSLVGIVANTEKEGVSDLVPRVADVLERHGLGAVIEEKSAQAAGLGDGVRLSELADQSEVIIVLGGDGTILELAGSLGKQVKPIAAINIGTLGFLTCGTTDELGKVVETIARGAYTLSRRSILQVTVVGASGGGEVHYAVNEAALSRSEVSRMITLEARINGEFFSNYSGDGLIVSTPTGSTAYSFSAGGAIADPASDLFLLTPICPHALANRSMIVSDDAVIEVIPLREHHEVALAIDGRFIQEVPCGTAVRISKAGYELPLVMMPGQTFYKILRQKLRWTGSNV